MYFYIYSDSRKGLGDKIINCHRYIVTTYEVLLVIYMLSQLRYIASTIPLLLMVLRLITAVSVNYIYAGYSRKAFGRRDRWIKTAIQHDRYRQQRNNNI